MREMQIKRLDTLDYTCTESLNTLCTNLSFAGSDVKKIMMTSCHESEGKSFLTMQIMRAMADMGRRVVLVDTDLRRSMHVSRYGIKVKGELLGLAHYLAGYYGIDDILYQTNMPGAYMIPIGRDVANPLTLFNSKRFTDLLDTLSEAFDLVLLDAPPVGLVIDAAEIAKRCDGVIFVVEYNNVRRRELMEARKQIDQSGCPILGCVLNKVTFDSYTSKKYYSRKYYNHYYDRDSAEEDDRRDSDKKKSRKAPEKKAVTPEKKGTTAAPKKPPFVDDKPAETVKKSS